MTAALLDTGVRDGIAVVTLNDPARRNAFTPEMVAALVEAFDSLESSEDCSVAIITGAGSAFCAGADLSHLQAADEASLRRIYDGFIRVKNSTLPTIAAVNGAAVGAGMNLALACDVRIIGESGRFDTRFLKLGIHPGGGHTWMLRQLVGPQTAAAMILLSQVIGGEQAVRIGLAWQCVPDESLLETSIALAAGAASAPHDLLKRTKATLEQMSSVVGHNDAVTIELAHQLKSIASVESSERISAMRREITTDE